MSFSASLAVVDPVDPVASAEADDDDNGQCEDPPGEPIKLVVDPGNCRCHAVHLVVERLHGLLVFGESVADATLAVDLGFVLPDQLAVLVEPSVLFCISRCLLLFEGSQCVRVSAHPLGGAGHTRLVAAASARDVLGFCLEVVAGSHLDPLPGFPSWGLISRKIRLLVLASLAIAHVGAD